MNRRNFLMQVAAGSMALGALGRARAAESRGGAKPNVLFFCVDNLRPELGCYGNAIIKSPNIDALARRGIVFNRAYCQQAVCSPSRSSLLTGTRPDTTKVWDLKTHFRAALPDVVTLPQFFKNAGYFVQGMGKVYHGGYDDPASWSVPWSDPKRRNTPSVKAADPDASEKRAGKGKANKEMKDCGAFDAKDCQDNELHDGQLADMAISALEKFKEQQEPFFLAVGFIKPHLPFESPKKYWDSYDPQSIPLAPNPYLPKDAPPYALADSGELHSYQNVPDGQHLPDEYARQLKHGYYAAVSYMDAQLGRVLGALDTLGLRENTIIVLWGDHGWKLGEHDRWCKHSNVENDTNAPLLISVPGMKHAGEHTNALVEFVDVYPTLAELAGLPLPLHLEGSSAVPLLEDPARKWKSAAFSQYPRKAGGTRLMGYSMRTERYRFTQWVNVENHAEVHSVELYDHETDPQENTNIAGYPENKTLVDELARQLQGGWQKAKP